MPRTIEDLLPAKPDTRLRIYAYSIDDQAHLGLLKVGQTTQDVRARVRQQLQTAAIENFKIVVDEPADRSDGGVVRDFDVRARLREKGFTNPTLEWMQCTVDDVLTVISELRAGQLITPPSSSARNSNWRSIGRTTISSPSGLKIRTQFQNFSGMRRCGSGRHLPRINSLRRWAQSASSL
jgi:hypothetical protein